MLFMNVLFIVRFGTIVYFDLRLAYYGSKFAKESTLI